ncbi:MAG: biotin transporter BioY [Acidobacteria bacterium]|nr:biotin transporter BioY [Acidobacteriota bacterium]
MSATSARGSLLETSIGTSDAAALAPVVRVAAVALTVALTATASQFTVVLPFTAVPFTLTPLVVILAGAVLGSRLGAVSQMAYLAAGIVGLQVFAPSAILPPGAGRLLGPTGGYLLAYPMAAFAAGYLAERGWDRTFLRAAVALTVGMLVIYMGGFAWMTRFAPSLGAAFAQGVAPFILADLAKVIIAAMMLPRAWRLLRG